MLLHVESFLDLQNPHLINITPEVASITVTPNLGFDGDCTRFPLPPYVLSGCQVNGSG